MRRTATSSRRSGTRRRQRTGRQPPSCSPTTISSSSSKAASRRFARCSPPSRPTRARRMQSSRSCSPASGCSTACSTRLPRTLPSAGGCRDRHRRAPAALDLLHATVSLALAPRRGDLQRRGRRDAGCRGGASRRRRPGALALRNDLRAAALFNLGIAEFWALRLGDARGHLSRRSRWRAGSGGPTWRSGALRTWRSALAQRPAPSAARDALRAGRGDRRRARVGGAIPSPRRPSPRGRDAGMAGRLDEAEHHLERAPRAARDGDPDTELIIAARHGAAAWPGALRGRARRVSRRRSGCRRACRASTRSRRPAQPHPADAGPGGETAAARAALAEMADEQTPRGRMRIAAAAIQLAEGDAGGGGGRTGAGHRPPARAVHARWARSRRCCSTPLARDRLGDRRAAETSLERRARARRARGHPPALRPVPGPASCSSATRATAPPTRRCSPTILDVLAGGGPARATRSRRCATSSATPSCASCATCPPTSRRPRSPRALRVDQHGAHASAPHLRQARRAQPQRGGRPRARARPARARARPRADRRSGRRPITQNA